MESKRMTRSQGAAEFPEGKEQTQRGRTTRNTASGGESSTPKGKPTFRSVDRQIFKSRTTQPDRSSPTGISQRNVGSAPGSILNLEKGAYIRGQKEISPNTPRSKSNLQMSGEETRSRESSRIHRVESIQTVEDPAQGILGRDEIQTENCSQAE